MCKEVFKEFFGFGSTKFEVTQKNGINKKMTKTHKKILISHFILWFLSILGLVMSIFKILSQGITVYILSLVLLVSNIFYLSTALIFDLRNNNKEVPNFEPNKIKKYSKFSSLRILFK